MNCPSCGNPIKIGAKFCVKCGTRISVQETVDAEAIKGNTVEDRKPTEQKSGRPHGEIQEHRTITPEHYYQRTSFSRKTAIISVLIIALSVAGAGFFYKFSINGTTGPETKVDFLDAGVPKTVGNEAQLAGRALPIPTGFVTDTVGLLDDATKQELTALIQGLRRKTTAQMAVVVIPTTGGEDIRSYSVRLFRAWGIGEKKKDNGLLFLVAVNDRKMRITTGYGIEKILPNARVEEICDTIILPRFKIGDLPSGIVVGTQTVVKEIDERYGFHIRWPQMNDDTRLFIRYVGPLFIFAILIIYFTLIRPSSGSEGYRERYYDNTYDSSGTSSYDSYGGDSGSTDSFGGGDTGGSGADGSW